MNAEVFERLLVLPRDKNLMDCYGIQRLASMDLTSLKVFLNPIKLALFSVYLPDEKNLRLETIVVMNGALV